MNIESKFEIEEIKCNGCGYPNKVAFQHYSFIPKDDERVNKLKEENEQLKNDIKNDVWQQQYEEGYKVIVEKNRKIAALESEKEKLKAEKASFEKQIKELQKNISIYKSRPPQSFTPQWFVPENDFIKLKEENEILLQELATANALNNELDKYDPIMIRIENEELKAENENYKSQRDWYQKEYSRYHNTCAKLTTENQQLKAQLQQSNSENKHTHNCRICDDGKLYIRGIPHDGIYSIDQSGRRYIKCAFCK